MIYLKMSAQRLNRDSLNGKSEIAIWNDCNFSSIIYLLSDVLLIIKRFYIYYLAIPSRIYSRQLHPCINCSFSLREIIIIREIQKYILISRDWYDIVSKDLKLKQNADSLIKSFRLFRFPLFCVCTKNAHNKVLSLETVFLIPNLRKSQWPTYLLWHTKCIPA